MKQALKQPAAFSGASDQRFRRFILLVAFVGLVVRLAILWGTRNLPLQISDERDYATLAVNVLNGAGFGTGPGHLTSIRPPLYPAFVASMWWLFGVHLQAIRVVQIILSASTALLAGAVARRGFGGDAGRLTAAFVWVYPAFVFYDSLLLTETLFTFLLTAFVLAATGLSQQPSIARGTAAGILLGLAALTRSVLWPSPLLICPLIFFACPGSRANRLLLSASLLAGFVAVVGPWAIRNTRLQGVPEVVDTMGGLNLRMGNYEYTPDDRMWAAVDLTGQQNWAYALYRQFPDRQFTEGEKDKWAQRQALLYIASHPLTTMRRDLIKLADFWGLERDFVGGVQQGLFQPPRPLAVMAAVAFVVAFPLVAVLGLVGAWLSRAAWRLNVMMIAPLAVILAGHVLAFGHSRYHVPLVPVLAVYASAMVLRWPPEWRHRLVALCGAGLTAVALISVWIRELLIVDAGRLHDLLARVFGSRS